MAAGLGFKDFVTGEVLTAADVDGYLMQGVWVFASAAARDAAVTSPQEGNFAYLKDTNVTTYYTGSAWANLDTTGMTNPMTTTGDTIYSSSGSTPARLGIGSTGNVLTVSGGVPTWATPAAGGGLTLISETVASGLTSLSLTGLGSYKQLLLVWHGIQHSASGSVFDIRFNNDSGNNYSWFTWYYGGGVGADLSLDTSVTNSGMASFGRDANGTTANSCFSGRLLLDNYTSTTKTKFYEMQIIGRATTDTAGFSRGGQTTGFYNSTSAITSIDVFRKSGSASFSNFTNTSIRLYGLS
jgi:hypothetical protein